MGIQGIVEVGKVWLEVEGVENESIWFSSISYLSSIADAMQVLKSASFSQNSVHISPTTPG